MIPPLKAFARAFEETRAENGDWSDFVVAAEAVLPGLSDLLVGKAEIVPVEAIKHANEAMRARSIIEPESLVVESMPFGALINAFTRQEYTPQIKNADVAYGLASAFKAACSIAATPYRRKP
jgi:hypothetical protein